MTGQADGEVSIVAGGLAVSGWTSVLIAGGLDQIPASFTIGMTEKALGGNLPDVVLHAGDACTIKIGKDVVLTGWINRVVRRLGEDGHEVEIAGRSRCQDLVDCSALPKNLSINSATIASVAQILVAPFAGPITVQTPDGDGSGRPYFVAVSDAQTPWEIISEIATYEGLLVHDDARGDLVICRVGTEKMASGVGQGKNVTSVQAVETDDQLYSTYQPRLMAQDALGQFGHGGNSAGPPVMDTLVKRYRPLAVISSQNVQGQSLAQIRAVWEATRRRGESRSVTATLDSWRDAAGKLWTHNVLVPVDLPAVNVTGVMWIIATWEFNRDPKNGTTCKLKVMPPEAFSVMPTVLNSIPAEIAAATQRAALGKLSGAGPAITAPNAGANGNPRAHEGYGL